MKFPTHGIARTAIPGTHTVHPSGVVSPGVVELIDLRGERTGMSLVASNRSRRDFAAGQIVGLAIESGVCRYLDGTEATEDHVVVVDAATDPALIADRRRYRDIRPASDTSDLEGLIAATA